MIGRGILHSTYRKRIKAIGSVERPLTNNRCGKRDWFESCRKNRMELQFLLFPPTIRLGYGYRSLNGKGR
jgi:hypothetical protein